MVHINPDTVRSALGIIGNVTSFLLFAAPMPTIYRMLKNKSVEEFKFHPYVAGVMNCVMWIFYSMPFVHPHSVLVTTINSVGLFLYIVYLIIYAVLSTGKHRRSILLYLIGEAVAFAALACVTMFAFHTHTSRSAFVGIFCDVFGIILYGSPLTVMWKVIKTKSVEFMPLSLSVTGLANGIIWSAYAFIRFDPYILVGNGIGGLLGLSQVILWCCYCGKSGSKSGPKTEQKVGPQVEMSKSNTGSISGFNAV